MTDLLHLSRTDETRLTFQHFLIGRDATLDKIIINKLPLIFMLADHLG